MRSDILSGGLGDAEEPEFSIANFSVETWQNLVTKGTITIGGIEAEYVFFIVCFY